MSVLSELHPGEARVLDLPGGARGLVHRPGTKPLYLVYEDRGRHGEVEPVGVFATWGAALRAVRRGDTPWGDAA